MPLELICSTSRGTTHATATLTALEALDLGGNGFGIAFARALAPALHPLTRLTELLLGCNDIGAAGAAALAAPLARLTALEVLDLTWKDRRNRSVDALVPVSYTHLTLPTILLV